MLNGFKLVQQHSNGDDDDNNNILNRLADEALYRASRLDAT
jgi:hypothetical protein